MQGQRHLGGLRRCLLSALGMAFYEFLCGGIFALLAASLVLKSFKRRPERWIDPSLEFPAASLCSSMRPRYRPDVPLLLMVH